MIGQIRNHLTKECLTVYQRIWYPHLFVKTAPCDSKQQWALLGKKIRSMSMNQQCLAAKYDNSNIFPDDYSVSLDDYGVSLDVCGIKDTIWQFDNNMLLNSVQNNSKCLTSNWNSNVFLDKCGNNYFQHWDVINGQYIKGNTLYTFDKISTVNPNIISLQNCITGECLNLVPKLDGFRQTWDIKMSKCDDMMRSQKWAWFGELLQSIDTTTCLGANYDGVLYLGRCDASDLSLAWQVNNTIINSKQHSSVCLTTQDSQIYLDYCDNNSKSQCWDSTNNTFTFSPTSTSLPTKHPTKHPTITPTLMTINTTSHTTDSSTASEIFDFTSATVILVGLIVGVVMEL